MAPNSKKTDPNRAHLTEKEFCDVFDYVLEGKTKLLPPLKLPKEKPSWYDEHLVKKGQEFFQNYFAPLNMVQIIGLVLVYSFSKSLKPLIYTRKSDSNKHARERYLGTAIIVKSWFEDDLWNPKTTGYKNIVYVQKQHLNISNIMNNATPEEIEKKCVLSNLYAKNEIKASFYPEIRNSFQSFCPAYFDKYDDSDVYINQSEVNLTLFIFAGMAVCNPESLGIPADDKEGLAGFVHLWGLIGHLLGIDDKYNLCKGDFDEVKEKCDQLANRYFLPNLGRAAAEWEHVSRAIVDGVNSVIRLNLSYELTLLYLCWAFKWNVEGFQEKISWVIRLKFFIMKFLITFVYRITYFRNLANKQFKYVLEHLDKKRKLKKNNWKMFDANSQPKAETMQ